MAGKSPDFHTLLLLLTAFSPCLLQSGTVQAQCSYSLIWCVDCGANTFFAVSKQLDATVSCKSRIRRNSTSASPNPFNLLSREGQQVPVLIPANSLGASVLPTYWPFLLPGYHSVLLLAPWSLFSLQKEFR